MSYDFWHQLYHNLTGESLEGDISGSVKLIKKWSLEWERNVLGLSNPFKRGLSDLTSRMGLDINYCLFVLDHPESWPSMMKEQRESLKLMMRILESSTTIPDYSEYLAPGVDQTRVTAKFVRIIATFSFQLMEKAGLFIKLLARKYKSEFIRTVRVYTPEGRSSWDVLCASLRYYIREYGSRQLHFDWSPEVLRLVEAIYALPKNADACPS